MMEVENVKKLKGVVDSPILLFDDDCSKSMIFNENQSVSNRANSTMIVDQELDRYVFKLLIFSN